MVFENIAAISTALSASGVAVIRISGNSPLSIAQKMLIETDMSAEKIAISVGFYDIQHFSKLFKKEYGVSPYDFRKANRLK